MRNVHARGPNSNGLPASTHSCPDNDGRLQGCQLLYGDYIFFSLSLSLCGMTANRDSRTGAARSHQKGLQMKLRSSARTSECYMCAAVTAYM
eukprot:2817411-Pyramimonas_sp.AAC.1